jgi:hypothetical protein
MFGRISNAGIAVGVVLIVVGGIIAWAWLGGNELGESPVDDAAGTEELEEGTAGADEPAEEAQ